MKSRPGLKRWQIFSAAACLLGIGVSASSAQAMTYAAGLSNSEWYVESSPLECRLWQPVPGFGEGIFSNRAGQGLSFYLKSRNSNMAPGKAKLMAEGAVWKPMVEPQAIGEVEVVDDLLPLQVPRHYAEQMLASLSQGLMPTISTSENIAAGYPKVKVGVSTVNFPNAYSKYQHCLSTLLPVSYREIARSAVFYAPGKTKLAPEVQEHLRLIASYVKADKRINRIVIDGHTDSSGDKSVNFKVSRERANLITAFFKKEGISAKRILTRYHGDKYPTVANDSDENRARNRRTTIRLDRE